MQKKPNNFAKSVKKKSGFSVYFWIAVFLLSLLKLWLISGQRIVAIGYANIDDHLFIDMANNIIHSHSHWLGIFNNMTLVKGPFYPIWIAMSYFMHVPLLISQNILYIFACLAVIFSFRPIIKKYWQLGTLYAVLLFNPMSYVDGPMTRVNRAGIYISLTLLIVSTLIGLFIRYKRNLRNILPWSLGAGLFLSLFWITREEGVWILPFAGLIFVYSVFKIWKDKLPGLKTRIFIFALPFIMLYLTINLVSAINYHQYGLYNITEYSDKAFLSAYGAMTRVKGPVWFRNVPVPNETMALIYDKSQAFRELKPLVHGDLGIKWNDVSIQYSEQDGVHGIKGGWFLWAFREAVSRAGYYSSEKTARNYYLTLAKEINAACDRKELDCYPQRASMIPPWNHKYDKPIVDTFGQSIIFSTSFKDFNAVPSASYQDPESLALFGRIVGGGLADGKSNYKTDILNNIGKVYQITMPYLSVISVFIFSFFILRRRIWENVLWMTGFFILVAILTFLSILSIISVTSFPAINITYVNPIYGPIILFVLLNIFQPFNQKQN